MDFYRKAFRSMERASDVNFNVTLELAQAMIDNTTVYNLFEFDSEEDLLHSHQECIFHQGRSNTEKVLETEYDRFCRKMVNFACLVQNPIAFILFYTPMKIMNPLPVGREFLLQYIEYHRENKEKFLTFNGSICYNNGQAIRCIGTWRSFENMESMQRMYNNWSRCYRHLNILPYTGACRACTRNVSNSISEPCQTCKALRFSFPNVTTVGNLFCVKSFKDVIAGIKNEMKDTYQRRSCLGLQPLEVRIVRKYLLNGVGKSVAKIEADFQLWVMILLSVNLFLRFDECCELKLENFEREMFTIETDKVQKLAVWIKGKCDKTRNLFAIRENVDFFDLDVLPVLMIYIQKKS